MDKEKTSGHTGALKLHLAPLHGVTGRVFRKAFLSSFPGFDEAMAPFILALPPGSTKDSHFKDLVPFGDSPLPLVPQLLGNDPGAFVDSATLLAGLGYTEVNWNLGCPYAMVAKKHRGAGLLPETDRVVRFLEEVTAKAPVPVSIKVRLGWKDPSDLLRLLPRLNDLPLKRIIIHPRLGIQMYKGRVDLEGFAAAAALTRHPLVYNGDLTSLGTFQRVARALPGIQEWMIGRGALQDPFLAGALKDLGCETRPLEALGVFHQKLYEGYRAVLFGPGHVLDKLKEVWSYLGTNISGAQDHLDAIPRAKTFVAYEAAVGKVLACGRWQVREKP